MNARKLLGILTLAASIFFTSCGVGPAVKELKKINDNDSRYWAQFIKKNGINAIDDDYETVLIYAYEKNNSNLIKAYIRSGADVNLVPGNTPPILYCRAHKNLDMVKLFLKKDAAIFFNKFNLIQLMLANYSEFCKFDDTAKEIHELLFSKMTDEQINQGNFFARIDGYYMNFYQKDACKDVLKRLTEKGFTPTKNDVTFAGGYLTSYADEDKFIKDFIFDNLNLVNYRYGFTVLVRWQSKGIQEYEKINEINFEYFIKLLKTADDLSDDDNKIAQFFYNDSYFTSENYMKKTKEVISILKERNYCSQVITAFISDTVLGVSEESVMDFELYDS